MAIEGPLRELALSDVFQLLDLSRKTGVLTIRTEGRDRPATVRFDRGAVVGAELWDNSGRIGHLLFRAGKVTKAEVETARREQEARPGWPLGSILVDLGFVSAEEVRQQLRFQIEEAVFDLIRWKDGYFRFEETAGHVEVALPIRMSTESLLMEAARRIDEWTVLEAQVPHMEVVPALVGGGDGGALLELDPDEWEVLAEIDGGRTLKAIAAELGRSDFDIAKIVSRMVCDGLVEVAGKPAAQPHAFPPRATDDGLAPARRALEAGDPRRAMRMLRRRVQARPDGTALLLLGETLGALSRWPEASRALSRAVSVDPLSAAAHYRLGSAAVRCGDLQRAEEAWNTYLRLDDASDARRHERAARAADAVAVLRSIVEDE